MNLEKMISLSKCLHLPVHLRRTSMTRILQPSMRLKEIQNLSVCPEELGPYEHL